MITLPMSRVKVTILKYYFWVWDILINPISVALY